MSFRKVERCECPSGKLKDIRTWWDSLVSTGPSYGYFPNASKTYLLVKEDTLMQPKKSFPTLGISIDLNGRRVLGSPIGSPEFIHNFVTNSISDWVAQLETLAVIAIPHPQAAFSAFVHGFSSKWTYLSRTCPGIDDLFQPLEDAIRTKFIPCTYWKRSPKRFDKGPPLSSLSFRRTEYLQPLVLELHLSFEPQL